MPAKPSVILKNIPIWVTEDGKSAQLFLQEEKHHLTSNVLRVYRTDEYLQVETHTDVYLLPFREHEKYICKNFPKQDKIVRCAVTIYNKQDILRRFGYSDIEIPEA